MSKSCKHVVDRINRHWSYEAVSVENISGTGVEVSIPNEFQLMSDFCADMDVSCNADVDTLWTGTGIRLTVRPHESKENKWRMHIIITIAILLIVAAIVFKLLWILVMHFKMDYITNIRKIVGTAARSMLDL